MQCEIAFSYALIKLSTTTQGASSKVRDAREYACEPGNLVGENSRDERLVTAREGCERSASQRSRDQGKRSVVPEHAFPCDRPLRRSCAARGSRNAAAPSTGSIRDRRNNFPTGPLTGHGPVRKERWLRGDGIPAWTVPRRPACACNDPKGSPLASASAP
jgi:hypothetical protein